MAPAADRIPLPQPGWYLPPDRPALAVGSGERTVRVIEHGHQAVQGTLASPETPMYDFTNGTVAETGMPCRTESMSARPRQNRSPTRRYCPKRPHCAFPKLPSRLPNGEFFIALQRPCALERQRNDAFLPKPPSCSGTTSCSSSRRRTPTPTATSRVPPAVLPPGRMRGSGAFLDYRVTCSAAHGRSTSTSTVSIRPTATRDPNPTCRNSSRHPAGSSPHVSSGNAVPGRTARQCLPRLERNSLPGAAFRLPDGLTAFSEVQEQVPAAGIDRHVVALARQPQRFRPHGRAEQHRGLAGPVRLEVLAFHAIFQQGKRWRFPRDPANTGVSR